MHPICDSTYSISVHVGASNNVNSIYDSQTLERRRTDEKFNGILGSTISLSQYETRNFKNLLPQILAALTVASFYLVLGISLSYSSILIPQLEADPNFNVTREDASWIASIFSLTTPVGVIAAGFLMDRYGRLNTVKLAALPGVGGWIVIALARNVPTIIIGRILTSLGMALGSTPPVVYVTEIARYDMRGSLISLFPALTSLGMILTFAKGWLFTWRQVAWSCTIYTLLPCLLVMLIPESPAWLVSRGQHQKAMQSLSCLNRYQPQPEGKSETYAGLQLALLQKDHEMKMIEIRRRESKGLVALFKQFLKPTGYKPFLILTGMFVLQRMAGTFTFLFYSITFFQEIGVKFNHYLASMLIAIMRFVMCMLNTYILSRTGRRPLVMLSSLLTATFIITSGVFTVWIKEGSTTLTWVPVLCLLLFIMTSMIGLVPVPVTMMAEVFPLEIRGVAFSLVNGFGNFALFLALKMYPFLYETFSGIAGVQFFFGSMALAALVYAYVFLPETHGKKLKEIEKYFESNTTYIGCVCSNNDRNEMKGTETTKTEAEEQKTDLLQDKA